VCVDVLVVSSAKVEVMQSVCRLSLILSVQDYCKSDEPISLKLDVMIGPSSLTN